MKQIREAIDRMNQCMNRLDRLYYMAARKLGVKDNSLLLYYVLSDETVSYTHLTLPTTSRV